MRAFLSIVWNASNATTNAKAAEFRDLIEAEYKDRGAIAQRDGFALYNLSASQDKNITITSPNAPDKCSITVVGSIFSSSTFEKKNSSNFSASEASRIASNFGRSFNTDYWGSYVAFIVLNRSVHVVSDPLCSHPCFYTSIEGVTLIFSHLEKCQFLTQQKLTINYRFLAQILVYDKIQNGETGLNEVRELIAGQRLKIHNGIVSTDIIWDPRAIANDHLSLAVPEAAELLKDTVLRVVKSRGAEFERITLNLSGVTCSPKGTRL